MGAVKMTETRRRIYTHASLAKLRFIPFLPKATRRENLNAAFISTFDEKLV